MDGQLGDLVGDVGDLPGPGLYHVLMVGRVVADVPRDVFLFQATDTVLQAWRTGDGPLAHQAGIALVGQEVCHAVAVAVGLRRVLYRDARQLDDLRDPPRL